MRSRYFWFHCEDVVAHTFLRNVKLFPVVIQRKLVLGLKKNYFEGAHNCCELLSYFRLLCDAADKNHIWHYTHCNAWLYEMWRRGFDRVPILFSNVLSHFWFSCYVPVWSCSNEFLKWRLRRSDFEYPILSLLPKRRTGQKATWHNTTFHRKSST